MIDSAAFGAMFNSVNVYISYLRDPATSERERFHIGTAVVLVSLVRLLRWCDGIDCSISSANGSVAHYRVANSGSVSRYAVSIYGTILTRKKLELSIRFNTFLSLYCRLKRRNILFLTQHLLKLSSLYLKSVYR